MSNRRRACRMVGDDSSNHFKTTESPWDDSKTRKLVALRIESERRRKTLFHLRTTAPTAKKRKFSVSYYH